MQRTQQSFQSDQLINRSFCRFHDSPHLNHIQVDLWRRINQSIEHLLTFKELFQVEPILWPRLSYLETLSRSMTTGKIYVENYEFPEGGNMDVACKGTQPRISTCLLIP
jgi:hypothetical protein